MCLQHRLNNLVPHRQRHNGLDADFLGAFHLSLLADKRIRAFTRHKGTITLNIEAAVTIIADPARTGI
ncbi:hypothetical protein D3C73_1225060 [compost metagenome]